MLYIRRIFHQDTTHQMTADRDGSKIFFKYDYSATPADRDVIFKFVDYSHFKGLDGQEVKGVLHPDASESRINGDFKKFVFSNLHAVEKDFLLIWNDDKDDKKYTFTLIDSKHPMYKSLELLVGKKNHLLSHTPKIEDEKTCNDDSPLQQIFYGAPGTGKSHKVKEVTETLPKSDVFRTTFHPDYDYASFVGCYKPTKEDDKITYFFIPQVFTKAYVKAWEIIAKDEKVTVKVKKEDGTETEQETLKPVYLVIEEINRGNCAQIFGDLFQLLDRNENGYSEYPIDIDEDLKNYLVQELGADSEGIKDGKLCLPPNLNLLATMNTSDQSLFPMDSAFKRRWDWEFVPIRYSKDEAKDEKDNFHTFEIEIGGKKYKWTDFLEKVNAKILSVTDSEDKQMGEYFIKKSVDQKTFINKVMYYLWSEVGKDMFGSTKPFFVQKTKNENGQDVENQFSFNGLFKENATDLLQGFMKKLEVKSEEEKAAEKAATSATPAEV